MKSAHQKEGSVRGHVQVDSECAVLVNTSNTFPVAETDTVVILLTSQAQLWRIL